LKRRNEKISKNPDEVFEQQRKEIEDLKKENEELKKASVGEKDWLSSFFL